MLTRPTRRTAIRVASALLLVGATAAQARAQASEPPPNASLIFDTGIVIGGDWLQANAMPLDRKAMQSAAFDISLRRGSWAIDAGFVRIARDLSTVQGGSLSVGPLLSWNRILLIPNITGFAGNAYASRDTTGYDYTSNGTVGHVPRYDYSTGFAAGGSVGVTIEVPLFSMIGVRGSASQWYFSGTPLEGDRTRTVLGAGLSVSFGR